MPNRPARNQTQPITRYGNRFGVKTKKVAQEKALVGKLKKEKDELVVPKTVGGMLTNKRYTQMRQMKGVGMGHIAALCLLHERGEFPGELLFNGTRKQLLDKKYKGVVKKARKELQQAWLVRRQQMLMEMAEAKTLLEKEGKIPVSEPANPEPIVPKRKAVKGVPKRPGKPRKAALTTKDPHDKPQPSVMPQSSYTNGNLPTVNHDPNS